MSGPIREASWQEFRDAGLLWWVNRTLHLFGWCLVFEGLAGEPPSRVYPARTSYRGFSGETEKRGFARLTAHLATEAPGLLADVAGTSPEQIRKETP
jgi:hypothetical protein